MKMDFEETVNFVESLANFRRKKVELAEAPEFTQRLTSFLEVEVGKSATFIGQFKSILEAKVKWFKEEEQLLEDGKHVFECVTQTGLVKLTILHLNRKDEGAYKCRVENQEGVATTTGYLSVIASKNRGRKSTKRKCGTERVSSPPLLNPIVEQRSVEEIEEKEYRSMPPSPLHEFLSNIRHCAKSMNAPIVYGSLDNFNDILDMDSLTDDEEVFEVNKKGRRSSDEEDFSTEESSSSEAEPVRTPTDQSLPQMLGLSKNCEHQISKFTPVRVYTAAKRHQDTDKAIVGNVTNSSNLQSSNLVSRPKSLLTPITISATTKGTKSSTEVDSSQGDKFRREVESQRIHPIKGINQKEAVSFVQSSLSSESRPLLFSLKDQATHSQPQPQQQQEQQPQPLQQQQQHFQQHQQNGNAINQEVKYYEWTQETSRRCCLVVSFISLSTFLSIIFCISPVDVILFVAGFSALFFLKASSEDQSS